MPNPPYTRAPSRILPAQFAGVVAEQRHALRRTAGGTRGAALSTTTRLSLDRHDKPVAEQLRDVLTANFVRVLDLFRAWDEDGNGLISREEFVRGMAPLGIVVPPAESGSLFDTFDEDGSGSIEYSELHRLLRQRMDPRDQRSRLWRVHELAAGRMGQRALQYPEKLPAIQLNNGSQSARGVTDSSRSRSSLYQSRPPVFDPHQPRAASCVVRGISAYEASKMLPPNPWRWPGERVDMDALSEIWLSPRLGNTSGRGRHAHVTLARAALKF